MSEGVVVNACLRWLLAHRLKAWRNNSGAFKTEGGTWIRYGDKGSPDILCRVPRTIGGVRVATLLGVECKWNKGKLSPDQIAWKEAHESDGGIYITAYSIDDLILRKDEIIG